MVSGVSVQVSEYTIFSDTRHLTTLKFLYGQVSLSKSKISWVLPDAFFDFIRSSLDKILIGMPSYEDIFLFFHALSNSSPEMLNYGITLYFNDDDSFSGRP